MSDIEGGKRPDQLPEGKILAEKEGLSVHGVRVKIQLVQLDIGFRVDVFNTEDGTQLKGYTGGNGFMAKIYFSLYLDKRPRQETSGSASGSGNILAHLVEAELVTPEATPEKPETLIEAVRQWLKKIILSGIKKTEAKEAKSQLPPGIIIRQKSIKRHGRQMEVRLIQLDIGHRIEIIDVKNPENSGNLFFKRGREAEAEQWFGKYGEMEAYLAENPERVKAIGKILEAEMMEVRRKADPGDAE